MDDMFWRMMVITFASVLVASASFLLFKTILIPEPDPKEDPIVVTDTVGKGTHNLTGILPVPSNCHSLSVSVREVGLFQYQLTFLTRPEPSRTDCVDETAYQTFYALVFAPALGAHFTATLDETPLDFKIVKKYLTQ